MTDQEKAHERHKSIIVLICSCLAFAAVTFAATGWFVLCVLCLLAHQFFMSVFVCIIAIEVIARKTKEAHYGD